MLFDQNENNDRLHRLIDYMTATILILPYKSFIQDIASMDQENRQILADIKTMDGFFDESYKIYKREVPGATTKERFTVMMNMGKVLAAPNSAETALYYMDLYENPGHPARNATMNNIIEIAEATVLEYRIKRDLKKILTNLRNCRVNKNLKLPSKTALPDKIFAYPHFSRLTKAIKQAN